MNKIYVSLLYSSKPTEMKKTFATISLIIFLITYFSEYSYNSSGTAPTRYTGAPGDFGTCASCHSGSGNPNNNNQGFLQLNFNNNNPSYQAGQTYNVTITNTGTNGSNTRRGFSTTVLDNSNAFVGSFNILNTNTTAPSTVNNRGYVLHRNASASINSWTFQWVAPLQSAGDVTFYVSTVTGNGSGSSGDIVIIDTFIIRAAQITPPAPVPNFSANKTTACISETISFSNTSTGNITDYEWNFGNGATPSTAIGAGPHQVSYSTSGQKTVSLTTTGPGGSVTETKTNFITINNAPNASAGNNVAICAGNSTTLTATGGTSYSWNNESSLSNANISNPIASPTVNTTYTVTVTNVNGCSATNQVTVTVNPLPNVSAGNDVTICSGGTTQLNATGGVNYSWNNGNTLSATNISNPVASPTVTTIYSVTATDANNCSNTATTTVNVSTALQVSISNDTTVCEGNAVQLFAGGGNIFVWNNGTTLNNINISNPVATPTIGQTTYTVDVTDGVCTGNASVTITVEEALSTSISNDTALNIFDIPFTIQLFATGGDNYEWQPSIGLNNAFIANPLFNPFDLGVTGDTSFTITYSVLISKGVCEAVEEVDLNLTYNTFVSANNLVPENTIVYPNPTNNVLYINVENVDSYTVEAISSDGKRYVFENKNESNNNIINVSHLARGIYMFRIFGENITFHRRVLVE